jgi:SAM-dependent methyltransferase
MKKIPAWLAAQETEKDFWDGIIRDDPSVLRVLADNSEKAPQIQSSLPRKCQSALEVGVGPLGLGIIGFIPEIPQRFAIDPLPPVSLGSSSEQDDPLRRFIRSRRAPIHYAVGCGEEIPIKSGSVELVVCCNVLDHTSDPEAILKEIHRILQPNGLFYFDVHTFSVFGLAKWHSYTKHAHKDEVLVKAHPYRMFEGSVVRQIRQAGFRVQTLKGHTFMSNLLGHARTSIFLGTKCTP